MTKENLKKMYDIDDIQSIGSIESGRGRIHSYYMKSCDVASDVGNEPTMQIQQQSSNIQTNKSQDIVCCACENKTGVMDNYIILSCCHIFHVHCLADNHFSDVAKFTSIDSEFFTTRTCPSCHKNVPFEEQMYLHSKFLSSTKDHITKHQDSINKLEHQLQKIKEELRVCYEYKNKLEKEREKSKQIVTMLTTMI